MNRAQFMSELSHLLGRLPEAEREDILYDFYEHFEEGLADGKTEQEITRDLGHPRTIAKELMVNHRVSYAAENPSVSSVSRAVFSAVGLSFFNLIFVLGPYIGAAAVIISLYAVSFSGIVSALALIFGEALDGLFGMHFIGFGMDGMYEWLARGFGALACGGFGVAVGIGSIYLTKVFMKLTVKYLKMNVRMIRGGKGEGR